MGDLPEPRYHTMDKDNSSVMMKVTATLGRNFIRSKEFQEAQAMGLNPTELAEVNGGEVQVFDNLKIIKFIFSKIIDELSFILFTKYALYFLLSMLTYHKIKQF